MSLWTDHGRAEHPYLPPPDRATSIIGRAAEQGIIAAGVFFGIKSFEDHPGLFGSLGRLLSDPEAAEARMVEDGLPDLSGDPVEARAKQYAQARQWADAKVKEQAEVARRTGVIAEGKVRMSVQNLGGFGPEFVEDTGLHKGVSAVRKSTTKARLKADRSLSINVALDDASLGADRLVAAYRHGDLFDLVGKNLGASEETADTARKRKRVLRDLFEQDTDEVFDRVIRSGKITAVAGGAEPGGRTGLARMVSKPGGRGEFDRVSSSLRLSPLPAGADALQTAFQNLGEIARHIEAVGGKVPVLDGLSRQQSSRLLMQELFRVDPARAGNLVFGTKAGVEAAAMSSFGMQLLPEGPALSNAAALELAGRHEDKLQEAWKTFHRKNARIAPAIDAEGLYAYARWDPRFRKEAEKVLGRKASLEAFGSRLDTISLGSGGAGGLPTPSDRATGTDLFALAKANPEAWMPEAVRVGLTDTRLGEDLMAEAQKGLKALEKKARAAGIDAKFRASVISHAELHGNSSQFQSFRVAMTIDGTTSHYDINLKQLAGMFESSGSGAAPYTSPGARVLPGYQDSLTGSAIRVKARPSGYVSKDEMQLERLVNSMDKIERQVFDRASATDLSRTMSNLIEGPNESRTTATGRAEEVLRQQALVTDEAMSLRTAVLDDRAKGKHRYERGVRGLHELHRKQQVGAVTLTADIEYFHNEAAAGGGAQRMNKGRAGGKRAFEYGATYGRLNAKGATEVMASVSYVPDLFRAGQPQQKDVKSFIRRFMKENVGATAEEAETLIRQAKTGAFAITYNSNKFEYDVRTENWIRSQGHGSGVMPTFLKPRASGESYDAFFARTMDDMNKTFGVSLTVVQNREADLPLLQDLFERNGVSAAVWDASRAVDTLDVHHALGGGTSASKGSLGAQVATLSGLGDESAFDRAVHAVRERERNGVDKGRAYARKKSDQLRKAAGRLADERASKRAGMQADLFDFLSTNADYIGNSQRHRADLDSLATLFSASRMADQHATGASAQRIAMVEHALKNGHAVQSKPDYVKRFGQHELLMPGQSGPGMYPFYASQKQGSDGTVSTMNPHFIPFARLGSPLRQQYQAFKFMPLGQSQGSGVIDTGQTFDVVRLNARGRKVVRPGQRFLYEGSAMETSAYLGATGGWDTQRGFQRTGAEAVLPESAPEVFEGSGINSPARARALRPLSQAHSVTLTFSDGDAVEAKVQEFLDKKDNKRRMKELTPEARANVTRALRELHATEQLLDSGFAEGDKVLKAALTREKVQRVQWIETLEIGIDTNDEAVARTLTELRQGKSINLAKLSSTDTVSKIDGTVHGRVGLAQIGQRLDASGRFVGLDLFVVNKPGSGSKSVGRDQSAKTGDTTSATEFINPAGDTRLSPAQGQKAKRMLDSPVVTNDLKRLQRFFHDSMLVATPVEREQLKARLVDALAEYSGMDRDHIRKHVLSFDGALPKIALTAEFTDGITDGISLPLRERAMKTAGLTVGQVIAAGEHEVAQSLAQRGKPVHDSAVKKQVRGTLAAQYRTFATSIEKGIDSGSPEAAVHRAEAARIRGLAGDIEAGRAQDAAALWDVGTVGSGRVSIMTRVLASGGTIDETKAGGEGPYFDGRTGAATKKRIASAMSTAITEASGPAGGWFEAWVAGRSGATTISQSHVRGVVARALQEAGVTDPEAMKHIQVSTDGGFVYAPPGGKTVQLQATDALSTADSLARNRAAFYRTVVDAGHTESLLGQDVTRVHTLTGPEVMALDKAIGKEARARMQAEADGLSGGRTTQTLTERQLAGADSRKVYVGGQKGLAGLDEISLFSGKHGVIEFDFLGANREDIADFEQVVRKTYGKNADVVLDKFLGPKDAALRAFGINPDADDLTDGDRREMRIMREVVEGNGRVTTAAIAADRTPTLMDGPGGLTSTSLSDAVMGIADQGKHSVAVGEAIQRIRELARNGGDVRSEVSRLLTNADFTDHLTAAQGVGYSMIKNAGMKLLEDMETGDRRFFAQSYKVARSPMQSVDHLERLREARLKSRAKGKSGVFEDTVREQLRSYRDADAWDDKLLKARTAEATENLGRYVDAQIGRYGAHADVRRWRGMGTHEGFISDDIARKQLAGFEGYELDARQQAMTLLGTDDASLTTADLAKRLRDNRMGKDVADMLEAAELSIRQVNDELATPGSALVGVMAKRDPDFTMTAGASFHRNAALNRYSMMAMGIDPDQVHVSGSPVWYETVKGDFDYDQVSTTMVDNPLAYQEMIQQKAKTQSAKSLYAYRMENFGDRGADGTVAPMGPDRIIKDAGGTVRVVDIAEQTWGSRTVGIADENDGMNRAFVIMTGNQKHQFSAGSDAKFITPGQAAGQRGAAVWKAMTEGFRSQQADVGFFGSYAKQDAILVGRNRAWMANAYTGLLDLTDKANAAGHQIRGLTDAGSGLSGSGTLMDDFTRVASHIAESERVAEHGYSALDRVSLMRKEYTQSVIEKYPKEGAGARLKAANEALRVLDARSHSRSVADVISEMVDGDENRWKWWADEADFAEGGAEMEARVKERMRRDLHVWNEAHQVSQRLPGVGIENDVSYRAFNEKPRASRAVKSVPGMARALEVQDSSAMGLGEVLNTLGESDGKRIRSLLDGGNRFGFTTDLLRDAAVSEARANSRSITESIIDRVGHMGTGTKTAAALAVGAVLLGAVMGGGDSVADGERYDTPGVRPAPYGGGGRAQAGSRQTTARAQRLRRRAAVESDYARTAGQRGLGVRFNVPPPPSRRNDR